MPTTFICIDATVDGKKVGGGRGLFLTIDNDDERTKGTAMQPMHYPKVLLSSFVVYRWSMRVFMVAAMLPRSAMFKIALCFCRFRLPSRSPRCRRRSSCSPVPVL